MYLILVCLLLGALPLTAQTTDTIRVCSYNLLNYPGSTYLERNYEFRKIITAIDPEIIVTQEMTSNSGSVTFLNLVLEYITPFRWTLASYWNGPDTDNGIFYDKNRLRAIASRRIETELRFISHDTFEVLRTKDTLHVFACHLKAGDTPTDRDQRDREAQALRRVMDSIPRSQYHLVAGDLNLYTSEEPAWQTLTYVGIIAAGEVFDPINRIGDWHDNPEFADVHTQSPRVRQFDGGVIGGMDDRFDFILPSGNLLAHYIGGSYTDALTKRATRGNSS